MLNLKINNIGKLNKVNLDLDAITILGAKNDSGKSTISKALGTSLNALNNYPALFDKYLEAQIRRIVSDIDGILKNNLYGKMLILDSLPDEYKSFFDENGSYSFDFINYHFKNKENGASSPKQEIEYLYGFYNYILTFHKDSITKKDYEKLKDLNTSLYKVNETNLNDIKNTLISRFFDENFKDKIGNFHNNNSSNIEITQNDNKIFEAKFNNENHLKECKTGFSQIKNVIYIESPLIIDKIDKPLAFFNRRSILNYENNLLNMLTNKNQEDILDLYYDDKLHVLNMIKNIINGKLELKENPFSKGFNFRRGSYEIETLNLATGIKSFSIIQLLLENNWLDKEALLIIDEPEVHLHPEWQVKFVEILILISKHLGVTIYLNTHSTYIIEAFQIISKYYKLEDKVNYYMLESNDFSSSTTEIKMEDLTSDSIEINKSLNKLYEQLNGAFDLLDQYKFNINFDRDNKNE